LYRVTTEQGSSTITCCIPITQAILRPNLRFQDCLRDGLFTFAVFDSASKCSDLHPICAASTYLRFLHDLRRTEPQKSNHSVNALISLVAKMPPTNTVCTEPNS